MGFCFVEMVVENIDFKKILSISIRSAELDDAEAILRIERLSYSNPWSPNLIKESLSNTNALNFVAFDPLEHRIYGFVLNMVLIDELHILNIAVDPSYRHRGIGNRLLETSISTAQSLGVKSAFLEVRRSNIKALTLYINHGFRVVGVRRGYYSDNREDALVMKKVM
jgi:ribosomal-protein-alanine N-acetyltransferase